MEIDPVKQTQYYTATDIDSMEQEDETVQNVDEEIVDDEFKHLSPQEKFAVEQIGLLRSDSTF